MRRLAAVAVLFVVSVPGVRAAEPVWEPIADADPAIFIEMDRASVEARDDFVTVWLRFDFSEPVAGRILPFRSAVAQHAVDCRQRRHAAMRMTTYSGNQGDGDVIDRWDRGPEDWAWRSERSETADAELIRLACDQTPATALSMAMTMSPP